MIDDELEHIRALRATGDEHGYLDAARELARRHPGDVHARMAAAYAEDRLGTEEAAVVHYDAAWALGVPDAEARGFLVGYGSTLRNVGRTAEAVAVLRDAVAHHADCPALKAFLALALHTSGEHAAAVATMLDAALDLDETAARLDGYGRALAYYRDELVATTSEGRRR